MGVDDLRSRTKALALRVIGLCGALPDSPAGRVVRGQLLRCGTSVGANYRAAQRAKSTADFVSKMGTVEEETDESMYWMEIVVDASLAKKERVSALYQEADEILAMVVASIKTAKGRKAGNAERGTRSDEPERLPSEFRVPSSALQRRKA